MPTFNTPERFLRLAIESVLRQTYPHWELCVADDGSDQPHVRAVLEEYAAKDERIKLAPPGRHGGIAAASNAALELATGDYVALLDHDDELAEHALYRMAQAIVADPAADMLYSDEDKLQPDGKRVRPFFKPDWSPEFFLGCMYTCHLGVYRTKLVREVGGFRPEFDGAQDYDLVLRRRRADRADRPRAGRALPLAGGAELDGGRRRRPSRTPTPPGCGRCKSICTAPAGRAGRRSGRRRG